MAPPKQTTTSSQPGASMGLFRPMPRVKATLLPLWDAVADVPTWQPCSRTAHNGCRHRLGSRTR